LKRVLDLFISIVAAVLLSPVYVLTAILILKKLGFPVFFKQQRIGYQCKTFTVYKFRTMIDAKDQFGNDLSDSERMTSFGRLIRKLSIDEIPQLWNVIKGDMSIVGPRPLLVKYLPYYTEEEIKRHNVRPGITGLAQVRGRNSIGWDQRLQFDIKYVKERSLTMDLQIIIETFIKVIKRDGVIDVQRDVMLDLDIERKNSLQPIRKNV
jgi:lipopolysaccharide/colanic/teichoic acid biosynthesis glycosyltransferase